MLHRSEKGEAKKKASTLPSLISMKKLQVLCREHANKDGLPLTQQVPTGTTVTLTVYLLYAASSPFISVSPEMQLSHHRK